ncbi:MAG: hypothetical protein DI535_06885 [Citrobacter freundii]|nr:MAG: hypothetical protein DI535_06885 [Citrobacter freundii]
MKCLLSLFLLGCFFATGMTGCKKDEASVPLPVDGLKAYAGKYRAKIEFEVPADAKTGKIFYGSGKVQAFDVSDATAMQDIVVTDLAEDAQVLRVVTMNAAGVSSTPKGVSVKVYGAKYQGTIKPRKWSNQIEKGPDAIELVFEAAFAGETGVQVVYTNTAGKKDSVLMSASSNTIVINNINTDEAYYCYSIYRPETDAIDDFKSDVVDLKTAAMLDFKKAEWTISGSSGDQSGMGAANLIDNNINSAWQSQSGGNFPYWVTIDMGSEKLMDGFNYVNYQGNAKSGKNLKFELSNDNSSFTMVLQAQVKDSYLRQRLPIGQTVSGRYLRITVEDAWDANATSAQIAEIDAYNNQNVSGTNGKEDWTISTPVTMVNASKPFKGDGSVAFPALGTYPDASTPRMQKLQGWIHSANAQVTYDNSQPNIISMFTAAPWGLPEVTNGKLYQSVNLQPGYYSLKISVAHADGPADAYGVVTAGGTVPDFTAIPASSAVYRYMNLVANQNKTVEMIFSVATAGPVNIGLVYNIREQYSINGTPWSSFNVNGFQLAKID